MIPKFRIYLPGYREILEVSNIFWTKEGMDYINTSSPTEIEGRDEFYPDEDTIYLMQYTGRKDKNDVEIFEGDYLSWISFESQKELKGEVVFYKGSFCMVVTLKGHDYKVPLHDLSDSDNLMEVLGNIWEDGDLLNGE